MVMSNLIVENEQDTQGEDEYDGDGCKVMREKDYQWRDPLCIEFLKMQEEIKDMQANDMLSEDLLEHLWALHIANVHDY